MISWDSEFGVVSTIDLSLDFDFGCETLDFELGEFDSRIGFSFE